MAFGCMAYVQKKIKYKNIQKKKHAKENKRERMDRIFRLPDIRYKDLFHCAPCRKLFNWNFHWRELRRLRIKQLQEGESMFYCHVYDSQYICS